MKAKRTPARQNSPAKPNIINYDLSAQSVKWFFTVFLSILVYFVLAVLVDRMYHPDIKGALDVAKQVLVLTGGYAPEPKEKMLFILAVPTFIICIVGFYYLIS